VLSLFVALTCSCSGHIYPALFVTSKCKSIVNYQWRNKFTQTMIVREGLLLHFCSYIQVQRWWLTLTRCEPVTIITRDWTKLFNDLFAFVSVCCTTSFNYFLKWSKSACPCALHILQQLAVKKLCSIVYIVCLLIHFSLLLFSSASSPCYVRCNMTNAKNLIYGTIWVLQTV
jgi:hypothetical protein